MTLVCPSVETEWVETLDTTAGAVEDTGILAGIRSRVMVSPGLVEGEQAGRGRSRPFAAGPFARVTVGRQ